LVTASEDHDVSPALWSAVVAVAMIVAAALVGPLGLVDPVGVRSRMAVLAAGVAGVAGVAERRRDRSDGLPAALEEVARRLRSGSSLQAALALAAPTVDGPLRWQWERVIADVEAGVHLPVALDGWAHRVPVPDVRLAVAAFTLGADVGGRRAAAIESVAMTLHERAALTRDVSAHATSARLSAAVLVVAPLVFSLSMVAIDPRTRAVLIGSSLGWSCVAGGIVLDGVGAWWMSRVLRGALPR
jgi:tight adherence protein B